MKISSVKTFYFRLFALVSSIIFLPLRATDLTLNSIRELSNTNQPDQKSLKELANTVTSDGSKAFLNLPIKAEKTYSGADIQTITLEEFKTLDDFLKALTSRNGYGLSLMRYIASEITKSAFKHFRIEFLPTKDGMKIQFSRTSTSDKEPHILSAYNTASDFEFAKYLKDEKRTYKNSVHTLSFPSLRGNLLVIPRGKYTNFYTFAKTAPEAQILDFFKHVQALVKEFKSSSLTPSDFTLASHGGSLSGQTVFHFHLRFEFHDPKQRDKVKKLGK